jgi:hypothetical protein
VCDSLAHGAPEASFLILSVAVPFSCSASKTGHKRIFKKNKRTQQNYDGLSDGTFLSDNNWVSNIRCRGLTLGAERNCGRGHYPALASARRTD